MNIYNAKNNSMPEQVLENKENIELLNTGKQDTLTAGDNITIDENNVISANGVGGGGGDIVIYDNANGADEIKNIVLEIGAIYELFITSAADAISMIPYGQQKVTIKLIPAELLPNTYDLYVNANWFDAESYNQYLTVIHIYNYDTELWTIETDVPFIKIYKIIKKAV